jgi:hypothetical protein
MDVVLSVPRLPTPRRQRDQFRLDACQRLVSQ